VEGSVGGRDHRRNVNLALKKSNLRIWTKTVTDAGKLMDNMVEEDISTVEKSQDIEAAIPGKISCIR
jgi:5-methylcytosine-specific restriction endonuclease McrA